MASRKSVGPKTAVLFSAALFCATPAYAGLNKGSVTVDSTIVYLGVVPATQTGDYSSERPGEMQMGGPAAADVNGIHLVVALFDHGTRKRVTDARVSARFLGERGHRWSVVLSPMTMNGALTYGAYSNIGANNKASIFIDVDRPFGPRTQNVTARFEYERE